MALYYGGKEEEKNGMRLFSSSFDPNRERKTSRESEEAKKDRNKTKNQNKTTTKKQNKIVELSLVYTVLSRTAETISIREQESNPWNNIERRSRVLFHYFVTRDIYPL